MMTFYTNKYTRNVLFHHLRMRQVIASTKTLWTPRNCSVIPRALGSTISQTLYHDFKKDPNNDIDDIDSLNDALNNTHIGHADLGLSHRLSRPIVPEASHSIENMDMTSTDEHAVEYQDSGVTTEQDEEEARMGSFLTEDDNTSPSSSSSASSTSRGLYDQEEYEPKFYDPTQHRQVKESSQPHMIHKSTSSTQKVSPTSTSMPIA